MSCSEISLWMGSFDCRSAGSRLSQSFSAVYSSESAVRVFPVHLLERSAGQPSSTTGLSSKQKAPCTPIDFTLYNWVLSAKSDSMTTTFRSIEILVLRAVRAELSRPLKKFCCKPKSLHFLARTLNSVWNRLGNEFFGSKGDVDGTKLALNAL